MLPHMTKMSSYPNQNLEAIGLLTSGIVHDFNNLLTSIMGQAALALAKLPPESDARTYIERTLKAAEYAAILTRQILLYSNNAAAEKDIVDVNRLIRDNVELFGAVFLRDITLNLDLSPVLLLVEGNRAQLQQIFMNLIINAAESVHTLPGQITIRTGEKKVVVGDFIEPFVGGKELPNGDYIFVEVGDTGVGMDKNTLNRIFTPFFSTKPKGRGLGLSAVLDIVQIHRGGILVQSQLERGSTFTILLPVYHHEWFNPPMHQFA